MPLSWNEIRSRALAFSKEWAQEKREHAEAKTFWNEFFEVFGLRRRHVASFEEPVRNLAGSYSFIDLFWKGELLAEHKSQGKDLGKAHAQAMEYIQSLQREGRGNEVPRYVVVSDFARIALHDLEEDTSVEFPLDEFHKHVNHFGFISGYKQQKLTDEDPINIKAVAIMGDLHDALEAGGYTGHALERLLVRLLFCLFAEDTGIFERNAFTLFIENHTNADGSDLGPQLAQMFQVLNTPKHERQQNLLEELSELPYVNGDLYSEHLNFAAFNADMRSRLLAATRFNWSRISPAIFGALFQAVMEPAERRQIGAHYTSERDILKVIGPLFLDEVKAELDAAGNDKRKLQKLHTRLANMRLLDPACGCGNFLVVSYRELRLVELEILRRLTKQQGTGAQKMTEVGALLKLDVDQMYGIEIDEWPARIAEVAMWLMDHQLNQLVGEAFGEYFVRLPLKTSPHIHHGNALRMDWNELLPASECTHVLGNPPFIGKSLRNKSQAAEHRDIWSDVPGAGVLDYVTNWYRIAAKYIANKTIKFAFVSTNSISQGEQVGILWQELRKTLSIHFAHRPFDWISEARGRAKLDVVIIGASELKPKSRRLFEYETPRSNPAEISVSNINPYLVDSVDALIFKRRLPLQSTTPRIAFGSMPNDGGHLLITEEVAEVLRAENSPALRFVRPLMGADEFIYNTPRWCLWLKDVPPGEFRQIAFVKDRLRKVKEKRNGSPRPTTQSLADSPHLFGEIRQPVSHYIAIPKTSSENRRYIPIAIVPPSIIASTELFAVDSTDLFVFGVLTSLMHVSWVRHVGGALESRFRYSSSLVYNNFPWPSGATDKQREAVEQAAQAVLDAREAHPDSTLADLYDPLSMPADLSKAHAKLDRAVDRCYRSQPFPNERNRVEYLFKLYQELTAPLLPTKGKGKRK